MMRNSRSIFYVLILLALFARAAVPAGFMPVAKTQGEAVAMMICTGSGPATIMVDPGKYAVPGHGQKDNPKHAPCPFAPVVAQDIPLIAVAIAVPVSYRAEVVSIASALPISLTAKTWFAQGPPSFSA